MRGWLVAAFVAVAIAAAWRSRAAGPPSPRAAPAAARPVRRGPIPIPLPLPSPALALPTAAAAVDEPAGEPIELDRELDGEPVIQQGRFAGWTRSQWRDWYGDRLAPMRAELTEARSILARAATGEPIDPALLARSRTALHDLELRIRFDESDLAEVERAR